MFRLFRLHLVLALVALSSFAESKPNVLFISIDDLNDYISPLDNHPGIKTPNFDRLAQRSVTFSNAHCAAPACHPSRVAVMTGVHPTTSGIYRNLFGAHGPRWRHESEALADAVVLSQHFRDHGYYAAGAGRFSTPYNGLPVTRKTIRRRGMSIGAIRSIQFRPTGRVRPAPSSIKTRGSWVNVLCVNTTSALRRSS